MESLKLFFISQKSENVPTHNLKNESTRAESAISQVEKINAHIAPHLDAAILTLCSCSPLSCRSVTVPATSC
jgi:hypothetical protein